MHANFCTQCGSRLMRRGWRARLGGGLCNQCAQRLGSAWRTPLFLAALIAIGAFVFGRYLRPSPPPLIIQRLANSPLSDLPANSNQTSIANRKQSNSANTVAAATDSRDDTIYICGARTKKGTPCQRRVHSAGERCFQHKGMPAMVPLEKLKISASAK